MEVSYCTVFLLVLFSFVSTKDNKDPYGLSMRDIFFTTNRTATFEKSITKREAANEIDLTYPGCGLRSPNIQESSRSYSNINNRRRGSKSQIFSSFTREKREMLIAGGRASAENSWPWMVALLEETKRSYAELMCGASLISEKYVLTAAHCFDSDRGLNINPSKYLVVVGAHIATEDGTVYEIKEIIIHPNYKRSQHYNDISILEVKIPIKLSKKVFPICLPSHYLRDEIDKDDYYVTVTGWGATSYGGSSSDVLLEVTIPLVPMRECNASYSRLRLPELPKGITKLFMCAGLKDGSKDACQGDSGGPLVAKLNDDSYVQVGVVSFGIDCATPGFPGIYTRVSQYIKWIYDNTDLGRKRKV